mgnify:CR=1 FL=1
MAAKKSNRNVVYAQLIAFIFVLAIAALYLQGTPTSGLSVLGAGPQQLAFERNDRSQANLENITFDSAVLTGEQWFEVNVSILPETKYKMIFNLDYQQKSNAGSYGTIRYAVSNADGTNIAGGDIVMFNSSSAWPTIPSPTVVEKNGPVISAVWRSPPDAATLYLMPDFYWASPTGDEGDAYTMRNFVILPIA